MSSPEGRPQQRDVVGVALRLGEHALGIFRATPKAMASPRPPAAALIEQLPGIYTLGGADFECAIATSLRQQGKPPQAPLGPEQLAHLLPSQEPETITLGVESAVLGALLRTRREMAETQDWNPPALALTPFGEAYRLGGFVATDYIEAHQGVVVYGDSLGANGEYMGGENTYN